MYNENWRWFDIINDLLWIDKCNIRVLLHNSTDLSLDLNVVLGRDIITNKICHKQFEQIEVCAQYYVHDNTHVLLSIYKSFCTLKLPITWENINLQPSEFCSLCLIDIMRMHVLLGVKLIYVPQITYNAIDNFKNNV